VLVYVSVALTNSRVDEDRAFAVTDNPPEHRKRRERRVFGVPRRKCIDGRELEHFNFGLSAPGHAMEGTSCTSATLEGSSRRVQVSRIDVVGVCGLEADSLPRADARRGRKPQPNRRFEITTR